MIKGIFAVLAIVCLVVSLFQTDPDYKTLCFVGMYGNFILCALKGIEEKL